ncbi:glycerophosphodiester phosphodiesterase [Rufibacter sediminis]|uniref:Glycerophosphodiester phosphodiesterase n=1 Tax=Rufibacter sediminis TaxID=2762756 RepID=A0ABR6VND4_9BACT|nr:glycerophosphodiester phosphodiesterase family protein [Rufibacter sediminis]MBC3538598.1 glycerophosphodiester phosphodiesterase [Rufibacter sediminis]
MNLVPSWKLLFCLFLGLQTNAMAQAHLSLTKYTCKPGATQVGRVVVSPAFGREAKVKVVGASAKRFTLGKDNTLALKKPLDTPWVDVVLAVEQGQSIVQDTFRIVRDEFLVNRVIAHRGAWKNTGATENSIGALQHAIRLGCAGSEFDVHMSADSMLFVHHDHEVNGLHLEKSPAAQLAQVKLANGELMPTLAAYLQEGQKQNKTRLILEIKPSAISKERGQALASKVVAMVQQYKAQGWVDYISFDYDILKKVQELEPSANISYLNGEKAPSLLANDKMYGLDYHQSVLQKNPHWIPEAHQLGLTVNVWTVNTPEMMDWLLERKADFITTNEPELLLEKIKKLSAK